MSVLQDACNEAAAVWVGQRLEVLDLDRGHERRLSGQLIGVRDGFSHARGGAVVQLQFEDRSKLDLAAAETAAASFGRDVTDPSARDELTIIAGSKRVVVAREGTLRRPEHEQEVDDVAASRQQQQRVEASLSLFAMRHGGVDLLVRDTRHSSISEVGGRFSDVVRSPAGWEVVAGDNRIDIGYDKATGATTSDAGRVLTISTAGHEVVLRVQVDDEDDAEFG
jgi:hypothetical protein